jgi:NodT family efflux transporter outer membrane factor (OMF) lipoprotein
MRTTSLTLILTFLLTLTACAPFKPVPRPDGSALTPPAFSLEPKTGKTIFTDRWWEEFQSPELNDLINRALSDNFDLRRAWARLDQARATARKSGADLMPSLTGSADGSETRYRTEGGPTMQSGDYSLGLSASYEVDLWGRIRASRESDLLTVAATREDLNTAAITLAGEISTAWVNLLSNRARQSLIRSQLKTNQTTLELLELRFDNSLSSAVDVLQQRTTVAQTRASLPPLEAEEQVLLHKLAILTGQPATSVPQITRSTLPEPIPLPAAGIPADLLAKRPDIRSAALTLKAADWEVSAAKANRMPALRLTGSAEYSGDEINLLFTNWAANLAAGLTGPIFDGNRRRAEEERTLAVAREKLAAYEETVYTALQEVEDGLINERKQREYIAASEVQLAAAREALSAAREQYRNGMVDYLTVLSNLLSVQSLEQNLITRRAALLNYRISLYRSLGGTWTKDISPQL